MTPERFAQLVEAERRRQDRLHPGGCWTAPMRLWTRVRIMAIIWEEVIEMTWDFVVRRDVLGTMDEGFHACASIKRLMEKWPGVWR